MSLFRILHVQLLLPPRYGDAKSAHCIELKINSDRMPTSSESGGERTTKEERSSPSNGSILGNDDGDGVPPELRAAMPNVVWSRQEDPSDDKVGQFLF